MPTVIVRNLSNETHRRLKQRAAERGNSMEAEIRLILDEAVRPKKDVGLGTQL
jgi:antitoxin FitA